MQRFLHWKDGAFGAIIIMFGLFSYHLVVGQTAVVCTDNIAGKSDAELQQILKVCEAEAAHQQEILKNKQQESASIARDIAILNAQIDEAKSSIRAKTILINRLSQDITVKNKAIGSLEKRIEQNLGTLSSLVQKTYEYDNYALSEVLLSGKDLSSFFKDVDDFASVNVAVSALLDDIRNAKDETEDERNALDKKRQAERDARAVIESKQKVIETSEKEKQRLLSLSKAQEKEYQKVLLERQAKAAKIRSALFNLRDTSAIEFGDALAYANAASNMTGVRPALILAILTQESDLGKNVGSCYLRDTSTGAGVSKKTGNVIQNVMHPTRDVPVFVSFMPTLKRDPMNTLISCPQSIGYGGAMGPSQFIPSTWKLFMSRISSITGREIADPWNPQDAITATSLYLGDLGASKGTYTAERDAACKYYSGKVCSRSSYATTYGNQVMTKAAKIQETMIDPLQGI